MQIIPLPEGVFTVDRSKVFVPFIIGQDELNKRPIGSLLVEVQPFLVITKKDYILLDTGLGFHSKGKLQIYENLEKHGVLPGMITKVLLSHLHKDHTGGLCISTESGTFLPAFPGATYYIQGKELENASSKPSTSFFTQTIDFLKDNTQCKILHGNGIIDDYIEYHLSGGHSPFHQVFKIIEEKEIIFYGGDEAPQLQQMKNKIIAKYDFDGRKSMHLRQEWWKQGNAEKWFFLFYHDVKTPVFQNNI
ncbi:MAG: MBL fold metallo-hydrolase [Bacteroidetes bacterium]|mgnify:CR=1 FL=1|nr:MBL fold metallo-hydrolase [Bacteroidota bacterium]